MKNLRTRFVIEVAKDLVEKFDIHPLDAYVMSYEFFAHLEQETMVTDLEILNRRKVLRSIFRGVTHKLEIRSNIVLHSIKK